MRYYLFLGILVALFAISGGCSDPKVDTSTDENMTGSIAKVRESLPEDKRANFDEALQILAFKDIDIKDLFASGASGINVTEAKVKQSLQGKTGEEIINQAAQIKAEREKEERVQALAEIKELEEKQLKAENAKAELNKFQIIRSRYYKKKQEFFGTQPIIELTVKNGTQYPVSRAYFKGTLASPGRAVPWLSEDFNYSISGGLEPGESASWSLSPNMFSAWGSVKAPEDAILTVEVLRLDGADGEALFSTMEFTKWDTKRLKELRQKYNQ